jgi:hypothetical protein
MKNSFKNMFCLGETLKNMFCLHPLGPGARHVDLTRLPPVNPRPTHKHLYDNPSSLQFLFIDELALTPYHPLHTHVHTPRKGPGANWESMAESLESMVEKMDFRSPEVVGARLGRKYAQTQGAVGRNRDKFRRSAGVWLKINLNGTHTPC